MDMAGDSVTINDDNAKKNYSVATYYDYGALGKSIVYDKWSIVINIRQLQTDLHAQYQHEKNELTELNQRFHLLVGRVQQLELLNSKYIAQIVDLQQNSFGFSRIDAYAQGGEQYLNLQSDLKTINYAKVDYELDIELFQLQIVMYQQLIDTEQQWQDKERLKLEQELSRAVSTLITLRKSYAVLGQEIEILYTTRGDTFKQYLQVAQSWCNVRKQRKQSDWSLQTLKEQLVFYKNISSYSEQ